MVHHHSSTFRQKQDTTIGTKLGQPYAVLFMGGFEDSALNDHYLEPRVWWRYIHDIFLWFGSMGITALWNFEIIYLASIKSPINIKTIVFNF